MFEAQIALVLPTLQYRTEDNHTLIAETSRTSIPSVLSLLVIAVWSLGFIKFDSTFIFLATSVSLIAGIIAAMYYKHSDRIKITPDLITYDACRLWSSHRTTAARDAFRGVRLKEYVTENDSRFEFYNVELLFSFQGLPKVLKVFEARNFYGAQAIAQELCETLSVRLEYDVKNESGV